MGAGITGANSAVAQATISGCRNRPTNPLDHAARIRSVFTPTRHWPEEGGACSR